MSDVSTYYVGGYPQNSIPATGFEWQRRYDWTCNCIEVECDAEIFTNDLKVGDKKIPRELINNIMKVLGYFPLMTGQIAGGYHIYRGFQALKYSCTVASGIGLIGRGILEFCCLGWLYIPIDLAKLVADGINYVYRQNTNSFPPHYEWSYGSSGTNSSNDISSSNDTDSSNDGD